jgi:hypothetical protein
MTKEEYWRLAPTYDRHEARRQVLIDAIPGRVNRAGRYYRKLIKIYEDDTTISVYKPK